MTEAPMTTTANIAVVELHPDDRGYALATWRESAKQAPPLDRLPWSYFKREYSVHMSKLLTDQGSITLGAYRLDARGAPTNELLGFLVASPGARIDTLHWIHVKHKDATGALLRRRGLMMELLNAAELGNKFCYTMRARKEPGFRTLDRLLAAKLAERGIAAAYVPLLEFVR